MLARESRAAVGRHATDIRSPTQSVVLRAAHALRAGQVVAIPTDTVYGLAAAIDRPDAIDRLYAIKGRPDEKAIPVLISDPGAGPQADAASLRDQRRTWHGASGPAR